MHRTKILFFTLLIGCGGTSAEESADSDPIIGGHESANPFVPAILAFHANGDLSLCSGVVASPHVILTAAHCVHPDDVGADTNFAVSTDENLLDDDTEPLHAVKST